MTWSTYNQVPYYHLLYPGNKYAFSIGRLSLEHRLSPTQSYAVPSRKFEDEIGDEFVRIHQETTVPATDDDTDEQDSEWEDDSKDVTVSVPTAKAGARDVTPAVTIGFNVDDIQDRLDDGQIVEALVLTSTRLESLLGWAVADQYDITNEQFEKLYGRESLGRYQDMAAVLDLFDQHQGTLQDVVRYRKKLVHDYGYLDDFKDDDDEREDLEAVIENTIVFIEQVEL